MTLNFIKIIRDPVHGYVGITDIELKILDCPYFQRLRYIKQNSMVYLTYPSASHSRFEHSLGTMHLAGLMYDGALESQNQDQIRTLLLDIDRNKIWQAIRLCAMVHDVGHPPFSHLFEEFVEECLRLNEPDSYQQVVGLKPAEYATLQIINNNLVPIEEEYRGIVAQIFYPSLEGELSRGTARILHQIISSQLDADRLDYILRDAYMSGFQIANPDVERIVKNLKIVGNGIYVADRAISSVETVIVERLKLYNYLYYHHKVKCTNEALRRCVKYVLDKESTDLTYEDFYYRNYVRNDGSYFDDSFIFFALHKFYSRDVDDPIFTAMKSCFKGIMNRKYLPIALWKTDAEYITFSKDVVHGITDRRTELRSWAERNGVDLGRIDKIVLELQDPIPDILLFLSDLYDQVPDELEAIVADLIKDICMRDSELAAFCTSDPRSATIESPLNAGCTWLSRGGTRVYEPLIRDIRVVTPAGETLSLYSASKIINRIMEGTNPFELNIIMGPKDNAYDVVKKRRANIRKALAESLVDIALERIRLRLEADR